MRAKRAPRSPMNDVLNFVQFLKFPCLSFPKNPFCTRSPPWRYCASIWGLRGFFGRSSGRDSSKYLGDFGGLPVGIGLGIGMTGIGLGIGVAVMCRAPDKQKRAPWRVSAIHEFQLFGLYSLSEETNPYRMGSLVRDGQTHVQGIFVRQGACSGLEVSENRDKSTVQKWVKNRSRPTPPTQKTSIYRQIVSPAGLKKGVQNGGQKRH
jgi:hypothetical protein